MPNFNKVILMGHLTRDPQLSYTPGQTPVVNFGLAVNRMWKDSDGQDKKAVCFVELFAFSKNAENLAKYSHKGDALHIEGHLVYESWNDDQGKKRSKLKVLIERFQFIGGRPKKDPNQDSGDSPAPSQPPGPEPFDPDSPS